MREKWKYGKKLAMINWKLVIDKKTCSNCLIHRTNYLLPITISLYLFISCKQQDQHEHISTNSKIELDGLVQATNQSVLSNLKTITPIEHIIYPVFNAPGVISYDPRLINNISAQYGGRIEKLYLKYNFQEVRKGQRIMDIYSPELLTAQQDLLFLLNNSPAEAELIKSSKQKLKWFGLTDNQITYIEKNKQVINPIPVYSSYSGHIHDIGTSATPLSSPSLTNGMSNMNNSSATPPDVQIENIPSSSTSALGIREGMYIQKGQTLFAVYNISMVWVVLNIFPGDAAYIKTGDKIFITEEMNPEKQIAAQINFIEPTSGQNASTIKARVYLKNSIKKPLKIGTIVSAEIMARQINGIWLPRISIINLGQTQITFIKVNNHFETKEIKTGMVTDSLIQIISGLNITDSVAANAQYLVDSESFIKK
jgi:Cu(I)/Ag(I) efflux system membrane fusion protein